jgi:OOP family OmpA-OmpF porin
MMKQISFKLLLLLMAGLLMAGCAAKAPPLDLGAFQAKTFAPGAYVPKVDNFMVIMDASSSMGLKYRGMKKFELEKTVIDRMNQTLPELGYTGYLRSFGPNMGGPQQTTLLVYGPETYTTAGFAKGMDAVKQPEGTTPLARAINAANGDLKDASGKTAVIIFSDGEDTDFNPVGAAQKLHEDNPNACIYTVVIGESSQTGIGRPRTPGQTTMEEIAKAGECGFATTAEDIYTSAGMADFVEKIFLAPGTAPPPPPPVVTKPTVGDSDGDGVLNDADRCPTTPAGARVDASGCWVTPVVYFDFDRDYVKPEFHYALDEVAAVLRNNSGVTMVLEGNTCTIGTEAYNLGLSDRRANQVAAYLINAGVPAGNLSTVGYGFSNPAASNDTEEGRKLNRRTEMVPSVR